MWVKSLPVRIFAAVRVSIIFAYHARMTPEQARALMEEWTQNPALRVHAESVAACMAACADKHEPDQKDRWIIAGLLHDFDYERYPTMEDHPTKGVEYLRANTDLDEGVIHTILAHAPHTGTARESMMDKCIFAVDELAGFIVACCKVRPNGSKWKSLSRFGQ